jgi:integral membrane sensor domain MASE1
MVLKIRSIRFIPIGLLLLLFVSNLYLGLITYPYVIYVKYVIFSVIYLALGLVLMSKLRFAELVGFIVSLAILFIYPIIQDFKNLHPWSSGVLSSFNAIVIVSCFLLLMLKIKD